MKINVDKKTLNNLQEKELTSALKNEDFVKLIKKTKLDKTDVKKCINKLNDSLEEISHCKECKSLFECKNKVIGHVYFPEKKESKVTFSYVPCKYQKKANESVKETKNSILDNAKMKDILPSKNRIEIIKWIKKYYDEFDPFTTSKGLYLHGNFGTGKTYLLAALLNELKAKFKVNIEIVYVPELLRKLKENLNLVGDKVYYLENVDILLLDDIGAEKVTEWGRDEILGTILQTRMNNAMPTFFTSNLNINELERHLSLTKDNEDVLKAKRIIERVKYLTEDIELLGNNYRE